MHLANLSPPQIADYARQAGFTGSQIPTITAIALAESTGRTDAYNPELASSYSQGGTLGSKGLTQIFTGAHPDLAAKYNLFDPLENMKAAFEVSNGGTNWYPWSTFSSGAYAQYQDVATQAAQALGKAFAQGITVPTVMKAPTPPNPFDVFKPVATAADNLNKAYDNRWKLAYTALGIGLILVGIFLYVRGEKTLEDYQRANAEGKSAVKDAAIVAA